MAEFAHLSSQDKVQKALELSKQGYTRQQIANLLYDTANAKNRLGAIRKLMDRNGFTWSEEERQYVLRTNSEHLHNKQETTRTNKQDATPVYKGVSMNQQTETIPNKQSPTLSFTQEEIDALKELLVIKSDLEELKATLQVQAGGVVPHATMDFTKFSGFLQSTTLQLHSEVWERLNDFCNQNRLSKKTIVNQAIWDFLQKWET